MTSNSFVDFALKPYIFNTCHTYKLSYQRYHLHQNQNYNTFRYILIKREDVYVYMCVCVEAVTKYTKSGWLYTDKELFIGTSSIKKP